MLETLVLFGHLVVAGLIITLVLLQRGKGAEAGTGFGAGASGTVFGSRGSASFFSRATAVLAALFFATSLTLAYFATQVTGPASVLNGSVMEGALPENSGGAGVAPQPGEIPATEDPLGAPPDIGDGIGGLPELGDDASGSSDSSD